MIRKQFSTFRLETDLLDALHTIKDRDGISVTEQARRALRAWAEWKLHREHTPEINPATAQLFEYERSTRAPRRPTR